MDINGNFILIKFSRISRLIKSNGFLKHRVNINGNLRLIDFSKFSKFQFGVKVVRYKIFLLAIRGGK